MKTIKSISIIILAVIAVAVSSCSKDAGFNGNSTIKGNVTNDSGAVVKGAIVSLAFGASAPTTSYNYSTLTDVNGNYSFNDLTKGNYYVNASYNLYVDQGQSFTLLSGGAVVNLGGDKSSATVNLVVQ
jgi:hypothetical protein